MLQQFPKHLVSFRTKQKTVPTGQRFLPRVRPLAAAWQGWLHRPSCQVGDPDGLSFAGLLRPFRHTGPPQFSTTKLEHKTYPVPGILGIASLMVQWFDFPHDYCPACRTSCEYCLNCSLDGFLDIGPRVGANERSAILPAEFTPCFSS
jgi:hypothetical protein